MSQNTIKLVYGLWHKNGPNIWAFDKLGILSPRQGTCSSNLGMKE